MIGKRLKRRAHERVGAAFREADRRSKCRCAAPGSKAPCLRKHCGEYLVWLPPGEKHQGRVEAHQAMQDFTDGSYGWALWNAFGATLYDPLWRRFYRRVWWYCFWFTLEHVPYWGFMPQLPQEMPPLKLRAAEPRAYR